MNLMTWALLVLFGVPAAFVALWLVTLPFVYAIGFWKTRPGRASQSD